MQKIIYKTALSMLGLIKELPEEIKALVEERKQARAEKNWAKSDEIRDRIISLGYSIKDTKDGIIVKKEN